MSCASKSSLRVSRRLTAQLVQVCRQDRRRGDCEARQPPPHGRARAQQRGRLDDCDDRKSIRDLGKGAVEGGRGFSEDLAATAQARSRLAGATPQMDRVLAACALQRSRYNGSWPCWLAVQVAHRGHVPSGTGRWASCGCARWWRLHYELHHIAARCVYDAARCVHDALWGLQRGLRHKKFQAGGRAWQESVHGGSSVIND
jgi:hypothetical protein